MVPTESKRTRLPNRKLPRPTLRKWGQLLSSSSDRTQQSRIPIFKRRTTRATRTTMRSNRLIRLTAKAQRALGVQREPELGREREPELELELEKVKIKPGTSLSIRVREREMLNIALAT